MKCKKCEAELEEGVTLCPGCGFDNSADEEAVPAEEPVAAEETAAAEVQETADQPDAEEVPEASEETSEKPAAEEAPEQNASAEAPDVPAEETKEQNAKMGPGKIALLVILAIAAIAVVIALVAGGMKDGNNSEVAPDATGATVAATIPADGNPDDVTCKGTYYVSDDQIAASASNVVATMGDADLTVSELQIYYWMQFYDFMERYGNYVVGMGLNPMQSLDTQVSIESPLTWQQFMLKGAIENWRNYTAMGLKAKAEGHAMDEKYAAFLADMPANLEKSAVDYGYENAEQMIQADMGKGAGLDAYTSYMETYYLGYTYYSGLLEQLELTDAMLEDYFNEHEEEYNANGLTKDKKFVDVRHILIQPKGGTADENGKMSYSEEEWETARAEAQKVLDEYLAGELTSEHFAELAGTYSQDPGSMSNGGLYTDVYEGQMVKPFEEWCFDDSRAVGDTGIVKTDYGFHVMYFVESRPAWIQSARTDLMADKGQKILEDILAEFEMNVDYSAIELGAVDMKMG